MMHIDLAIECNEVINEYLAIRVYSSTPKKDGSHISVSAANNLPKSFFRLSKKDRKSLLLMISSSIECCMKEVLNRKEQEL